MIKSMTGYGASTTDLPSGKYTVEIKSLNSKFLELNLKLPKAFSEKEFFLRTEGSKAFERGKVVLSITADNSELPAKGANINKALFIDYYRQLKAIADEVGDESKSLTSIILGLPDVVHYDENSVSEEDWQKLLAAFYDAVERFQQFRQDEGAVLERELADRIKNILDFLAAVEQDEPKRIPTIKEKLNTLLADVVGKESVDGNRLEQELIYYIDKLDITEEKVRLRSHCNYFMETLRAKDANGKKLGFISQEIGREINTMGSKANDASIQRHVVGMKEELEKVKEQLLNVL
ncbi:YicC/YloC family endoribonuclease [Pelobium manganitolerans]|uniref:YicC/YloC family endoribonuclease n=1 Tax=Pelobium manganitolerans TaxID=1842495 RepID=UPI003FA37ADF